MRKQNYLNNKDMLKEIHKSKLSFCSLVEDEYSRFDVIVENTSYFVTKKSEFSKILRKNRGDINKLTEEINKI